MKTAMQELIEELEEIKGYKYGGLVIRLIKDKLEKEKEQIIKSHINGQSEFDMLEYRDINKTLSEIYYNETYNQNK